MTAQQVGGWFNGLIKNIPDAQAAGAALLVVGTAGVALGAAVNRMYTDFHDTPARVEALSDTVTAQFESVNLRLEAVEDGQRAQAESSDLLLCMVRAIYRDQEIDAMSCRDTSIIPGPGGEP